MVKAFISYFHKDESLRNELESHLSMLKRSGVIETWHDRRIVGGSELDSAISEQRETAQIIMLLISSDFSASKYCYGIEMRRALEMHKEGKAVIVPAILRPCDWHASPFCGLMAPPTDGLPVTKLPNQDEAFTTIVKEVCRVAAGFKMPTIAPVATAALAGPKQDDPLAASTSLGKSTSAASGLLTCVLPASSTSMNGTRILKTCTNKWRASSKNHSENYRNATRTSARVSNV